MTPRQGRARNRPSLFAFNQNHGKLHLAKNILYQQPFRNRPFVDSGAHNPSYLL
jgi:hypothetical protein